MVRYRQFPALVGNYETSISVALHLVMRVAAGLYDLIKMVYF